jgi:hypothetical protein
MRNLIVVLCLVACGGAEEPAGEEFAVQFTPEYFCMSVGGERLLQCADAASESCVVYFDVDTRPHAIPTLFLVSNRALDRCVAALSEADCDGFEMPDDCADLQSAAPQMHLSEDETAIAICKGDSRRNCGGCNEIQAEFNACVRAQDRWCDVCLVETPGVPEAPECSLDGGTVPGYEYTCTFPG